MINKMRIIKKEAEYEEVEVGDFVELLADYVLFKAGIVGEVAGFSKDRIKVEFPMSFMNKIGNSKQLKSDSFIYAQPSQLKFIEKGLKLKGK
jgi:hypothetical protein